MSKKEKDLKKKDEKLEKDIDKTEKKDAETVEAQADNADADNTASDAEAAGDTDNDLIIKRKIHETLLLMNCRTELSVRWLSLTITESVQIKRSQQCLKWELQM